MVQGYSNISPSSLSLSRARAFALSLSPPPYTAKRDPATGKFIKREDGKIIKPVGWTAPDVNGEILRQIQEGSFPNEAMEAKVE